MNTTSIYGFSNKQTAENFFDQAKQAVGLDAKFIDVSGRVQYSKDLGNFDAVDANPVFLIVTYPIATEIAAEDNAEGEGGSEGENGDEGEEDGED